MPTGTILAARDWDATLGAQAVSDELRVYVGAWAGWKSTRSGLSSAAWHQNRRSAVRTLEASVGDETGWGESQCVWEAVRVGVDGAGCVVPELGVGS